ncbi:MAG: hypothetical protein KDJ52_09250 [Anaerolineae bacterium]|nr:hypothetical protein [Anaerolineae bacterium]
MIPKETHSPIEPIEAHIKILAHNFTYPSTPDLAGEFKARSIKPQPNPPPATYRVMWAAAIALVIAIAILSASAASPARILLLEFLQLSPIRIFLIEPYQATITPTATATHSAALSPKTQSDAALTIAAPTLAATPIVAVPNLFSMKLSSPAQPHSVEPVFYQPDPLYLEPPNEANR